MATGLFDDEIHELVCEECGKAFESEDVNAQVCPACWETLIDFENEGQG